MGTVFYTDLQMCSQQASDFERWKGDECEPLPLETELELELVKKQLALHRPPTNQDGCGTAAP